MNILTNLRQKDGAYRPQKFKKRHIVLHFTAGSTHAGAVASLLKSGATTAYIVGRKAEVHEFMSPEYWDSHLYRHAKKEDPLFYEMEKQSIGIEIVNIGPLLSSKQVKVEIGSNGKPTGKRPDPAWLYTYTSKKYCLVAETEKYIAAEYRGRSYWCPFTEEQYQAVYELIHMLGDRFQIPIQFLPEAQRLEVVPIQELAAFTGITTHVNYRKDKYDIGPAWNWNRLILQGAPMSTDLPRF